MGDCIFEQEKAESQKKGGPTLWYDVQAFLVNLSLYLINNIFIGWLRNTVQSVIQKDIVPGITL